MRNISYSDEYSLNTLLVQSNKLLSGNTSKDLILVLITDSLNHCLTTQSISNILKIQDTSEWEHILNCIKYVRFEYNNHSSKRKLNDLHKHLLIFSAIKLMYKKDDIYTIGTNTLLHKGYTYNQN